MTTSATSTRFGRMTFAIVLAYLLAFQSFLVTAATASEPGARTFGILCSHKGSGPDQQRHHAPPCCTTASCSTGIVVLGPVTAPDGLARRIATLAKQQIDAQDAHLGTQSHRGFEARGPPLPV